MIAKYGSFFGPILVSVGLKVRCSYYVQTPLEVRIRYN